MSDVDGSLVTGEDIGTTKPEYGTGSKDSEKRMNSFQTANQPFVQIIDALEKVGYYVFSITDIPRKIDTGIKPYIGLAIRKKQE